MAIPNRWEQQTFDSLEELKAAITRNSYALTAGGAGHAVYRTPDGTFRIIRVSDLRDFGAYDTAQQAVNLAGNLGTFAGKQEIVSQEMAAERLGAQQAADDRRLAEKRAADMTAQPTPPVAPPTTPVSTPAGAGGVDWNNPNAPTGWGVRPDGSLVSPSERPGGTLPTPPPSPAPPPKRVKEATLHGPGGKKEVVQVGSARASQLQSQGWGLTKGSYRAPPAPPRPTPTPQPVAVPRAAPTPVPAPVPVAPPAVSRPQPPAPIPAPQPVAPRITPAEAVRQGLTPIQGPSQLRGLREEQFVRTTTPQIFLRPTAAPGASIFAAPAPSPSASTPQTFGPRVPNAAALKKGGYKESDLIRQGKTIYLKPGVPVRWEKEIPPAVPLAVPPSPVASIPPVSAPIPTPVEPSRATLIDPKTGDRQAVIIGSPEERQLFTKGYELETSPNVGAVSGPIPTGGIVAPPAAPAPSPTIPPPTPTLPTPPSPPAPPTPAPSAQAGQWKIRRAPGGKDAYELVSPDGRIIYSAMTLEEINGYASGQGITPQKEWETGITSLTSAPPTLTPAPTPTPQPELSTQTIVDAILQGVDTDVKKLITTMTDQFGNSLKAYKEGQAVNEAELNKQFEELKVKNINPYFKQLITNYQADLLHNVGFLTGQRRTELEGQQAQFAEETRRQKAELEASGMTFSGEALRLLGAESAFGQRVLPPGTLQRAAEPLRMEEIPEGQIPQSQRLLSSSRRARSAEQMRDLAMRAERELGSANIPGALKMTGLVGAAGEPTAAQFLTGGQVGEVERQRREQELASRAALRGVQTATRQVNALGQPL